MIFSIFFACNESQKQSQNFVTKKRDFFNITKGHVIMNQNHKKLEFVESYTGGYI